MPITFYCDACKGRMKVPNELGGKRGKCAHCQATVTIPPSPFGHEKKAASGSDAKPITLSESSERELANSLALPTDEGPLASLEHERLALERAKLEFDRRKLERDREELERAKVEPEDDPALDQGGVQDSDTIECPACCEEIKARAKVCKHCGTEITRDRLGRAKRRPAAPRRGSEGPRGNPALAAVLSFLLTGLGQLYLGEVSRGLLMLVGAIACAFLGLFFLPIGLLCLCIWVYSIVDAVVLAQRPRLVGSRVSDRYR